ncbi:inovirus-type Gp2 protein [Vibrio harveyi]|nr:inovirus-type Gp2 protein [Vibrio harveyi]
MPSTQAKRNQLSISPNNSQYHLLRNSEEFGEVFQSVFYRLSYLAKRRTKHFGKRMNNFDHSRK